MRLGAFLHVVFGYVYSTSKYNEFGRVILKTPFPDLNSMLIQSCLSEDSESVEMKEAHKRREIHHPHTDKQTFLELLKDRIHPHHSIFIIKKNRNGHYKFEVLKQVFNTTILVLIDSDPNEISTSSIGVLSPHKFDKGPKDVLFTIHNFNSFVKKFRITAAEDTYNLDAIAALNAFSDDNMQPKRKVTSRIRQNLRAVKKGYRQYVLNESVSMSRTPQKTDQQ